MASGVPFTPEWWDDVLDQPDPEPERPPPKKRGPKPRSPDPELVALAERVTAAWLATPYADLDEHRQAKVEGLLRVIGRDSAWKVREIARDRLRARGLL